MVLTKFYMWKQCGWQRKMFNFYFAITSPTYIDENENIKKIGLCELCVNEYKLDSFIKTYIQIRIKSIMN